MENKNYFFQLTFVILFVLHSFSFVKGNGDRDECYCSPNQTIAPSQSLIIGSPTTTGTLNGDNCATNCSTIFNLSTDADNNLGYGFQISTVQCSGFDGSKNTLTIYEDENVYQTFQRCPSFTYKFPIKYPHIYTFSWNLITPVEMIFIQQPITVPLTTTPAAIKLQE